MYVCTYVRTYVCGWLFPYTFDTIEVHTYIAPDTLHTEGQEDMCETIN